MDADDFDALPREEFQPLERDGAPRLGPRFAPYQAPASDTRPKFLVPDECDEKVLAEALWSAIATVNAPPALFNAGGLAWIERDVRGQPVGRPLAEASERRSRTAKRVLIGLGLVLGVYILLWVLGLAR